MTRDDIINMAQTAGWEMPSTFNENDGFCSRLERFAALAFAAGAAVEREACAQVVEAIDRNGAWVTKAEAAAAIRARGEQ
jgi:hypothetical protein